MSGSRFYSPYEIVVSQPVLATIREHIAADLDREVLGLLDGELLVCPETLRRWIKVKKALEPVPPAPVGVNGENIEQALLPLVAEARGKGWSPIGWYHVCGRKSFSLSETEADIHARYFSLPWHLVLLVLADLGRPAGGIFVRSESGRLSRNQYRPFYELLAGDAQLTNGRVRTFVGWQNYMTDAPVVRAFSEADELHSWKVTYPDKLPLRERRARRTRRAAIAAALVALAASGWALRDRLPSQPFDTLSSFIEFASPGEADPSPGSSPGSESDAGAELAASVAPESLPAIPAEGTVELDREAASRFSALAAAYEQTASSRVRGEVGCPELATAYRTLSAAFADLMADSARSGDQFLDVAGRLNRSIENGTNASPPSSPTDPEARMRRIRADFQVSGCGIP